MIWICELKLRGGVQKYRQRGYVNEFTKLLSCNIQENVMKWLTGVLWQGRVSAFIVFNLLGLAFSVPQDKIDILSEKNAPILNKLIKT